MPIPLAVMPPFMAYQSILIGDAFGRGYQFGKRKISELSNEQIKKMSIDDVFRDASVDYLRMIPTVERSMAASLDLQIFIVKELIKVIPAMLAALEKEAPPIIKNALDTAIHQGFGLEQLAKAITSGFSGVGNLLPEASAHSGGVTQELRDKPPILPRSPNVFKDVKLPPADFRSVHAGVQKTVSKPAPLSVYQSQYQKARKEKDSLLRQVNAAAKHNPKPGNPIFDVLKILNQRLDGAFRKMVKINSEAQKFHGRKAG